MPVANYAETSYQWTITCGNNCSKLFLFRAVNAHGPPSEQSHGGFYTRVFRILNPKSSSVTAALITTNLVESNMTPSTGTSSVTTSAPSSFPSSMPSAPSPATSLVTTSVPSQATAGNNAQSTSDTDRVNSSRSSDSSAHVIGIGVGVGVGVAGLLVGCFFLWRRYHKRMKEKYSQPRSDTASSVGEWHDSGAAFQTAESRPQVAYSEAPAKEATAPVEAPAQPIERQELPVGIT